eukprot:689575-Pelagomonas_calceolata.AAC.8
MAMLPSALAANLVCRPLPVRVATFGETTLDIVNIQDFALNSRSRFERWSNPESGRAIVSSSCHAIGPGA